jgi:hypothetical protein
MNLVRNLLRCIVPLFAPLAALRAADEIRVAPPADPDADAVPFLRAALERVRTEGARRLVLEPGICRLPRRADRGQSV